MVNPYTHIPARITDIIEETSNIKTFVFRLEGKFSFETGQFVELAVPGVGEAPFTPSSNPAEKEKIEITIMKAGTVTSVLHSLKRGAVLGVRGPLGTGYPLEAFKNKEVLIIGGGVGLAPLRSLLYSLFDRERDFDKIILRCGARTPKDLVYKDELSNWSKKANLDLKVTVDKKEGRWGGNVGLVTTILDDLYIDKLISPVIVCGPPVMMKFVTFKLLSLGFNPANIYLSMEKNMSCGIGKCGHCRLGYFYCCKDGPVFTYEKIKDFPNIWE